MKTTTITPKVEATSASIIVNEIRDASDILSNIAAGDIGELSFDNKEEYSDKKFVLSDTKLDELYMYATSYE